MSAKANEILKIFKPRRLIWPILIGLAVASYLLWRDFDKDALYGITWTWNSSFWLFMAFLMMVIRDLGYMVRIRVLSDKQIGFRESFDVVMLWEFASAITPSVVGGSAVAVYIVNKEGINLGKSSAVVLITALMDEIFFVLMVPALFLIVGQANLFPVDMEKTIFGLVLSIKGIFFLSYLIILFYVVIITYALVFKPRGFKWLLLKFFKIPFLRKWRVNAQETGNEIVAASIEIRKQPVLWWLKAFAATFFSWTARYWVVNCLILAFVPMAANLSFLDHFLIYARQLVMWIIMLISPTPGSGGVAELAFSSFLSEFTYGIGGVLAVIWRLISYYPYLFIGVIVLPRWLRRVYSRPLGEEIKSVTK
jgi:glycosyltransferase 2 family protein